MLRKRATQAGASEEQMDEAADSEDEVAALVELVVRPAVGLPPRDVPPAVACPGGAPGDVLPCAGGGGEPHPDPPVFDGGDG